MHGIRTVCNLNSERKGCALADFKYLSEAPSRIISELCAVIAERALPDFKRNGLASLPEKQNGLFAVIENRR